MLYWGQILVNISDNRHVFGTIKSFMWVAPPFMFTLMSLSAPPMKLVGCTGPRLLPIAIYYTLHAEFVRADYRIVSRPIRTFHLPRVLADGNSRYHAATGKCATPTTHLIRQFDYLAQRTNFSNRQNPRQLYISSFECTTSAG